MALRALVLSWGRGPRLSIGELNPGVGGDNLGDAGSDEQQSLTVISTAHQRNGFTLKATGFAVGKNRLEAVSDFNAGAVVANGVENQDAAVMTFSAHAPFLSKIDRVILNVGAVESIDGHYGDLSMGLFVDLTADVFHL